MSDINFSKIVLIIRGVSGSSKSTFANYLSSLTENTFFNITICTADDYYIEKYGSYKWNAQEIGAAHSFCKDKFEKALQNEDNLVVVANTSSTTAEIQPYIDLATKYSYNFFSIIMENRNNTINTHLVPEASLIKQENNLRHNLKLR